MSCQQKQYRVNNIFNRNVKSPPENARTWKATGRGTM